MGRKKIEIERIDDERIRRVTFKKRRIGLLKKAIQLSKLTDAKVLLKVYHEEDDSLIELFSHQDMDFDKIEEAKESLSLYSRFHNRHYNLVARLDERVTKQNSGDGEELELAKDMGEEFQGINIMQLFSLAKKPAPTKPKQEAPQPRESSDNLGHSVMGETQADDTSKTGFLKKRTAKEAQHLTERKETMESLDQYNATKPKSFLTH